MKQRSFSVFGNIAVVNFSNSLKWDLNSKKKFALEILKKNKAITTVLEKCGNFKGRLRKMNTRFLGGENTKEVLYKENGCVFRFNIDETYFSPRLSNERKEIASLIKKQEEVFVAFAGVGPFPIVIAKNSLAKKIYFNEINRKANSYAKLNIELNKLKDKGEIVPGDFKKVALKFQNEKKTFDVIVMPRPQLKDSFLESAFKISKKGTRIYYYDFCGVDEIDSIVEKIKDEALRAKKKIKILKKKIAGEIAPYKVRVRIDFKLS